MDGERDDLGFCAGEDDGRFSVCICVCMETDGFECSKGMNDVSS